MAILDSETDGGKIRASDKVRELLVGAIDLHCHSGPSMMRRQLDHIDAMKEAAAAGFEAVVMKDHYYCTAPTARLIRDRFSEPTEMLGGIVLNNAVGGLNPYAVEHAAAHGVRVVWLPTLDAENHIRAQEGVPPEKAFPRRRPGALPNRPVPLFDGSGQIRDELKHICDIIAASNLVLSAGHVHKDEALRIFEEARKRGVSRFVMSHPDFILGASMADIRSSADWGVTIEHSICMWFGGPDDVLYDRYDLAAFIEAGGVTRTIFGSDLGQFGNPTPVQGFARMVGLLLDTGYGDVDILAMVGGNARALLGESDRGLKTASGSGDRDDAR